MTYISVVYGGRDLVYNDMEGLWNYISYDSSGVTCMAF